MRFATLALLALAALAGCSPPAPKPSPKLAWAYPTGKPVALPAPPAGPQHVPGSPLTLDLVAIEKAGALPDWFPDEHPAPPAIVAHAAAKGPTPCGECHLIAGVGFPGAADLEGLPAAYIIEQVKEFRAGRRRSAQADRLDTLEMIKVAQQVSDADLAAAAAYYAALTRRARHRVIETDTVPATRPSYFGWLDLVANGKPEPIAGRIIEVPEDTDRLFLSDPHLTIIDYAPFGSVVRGEKLVRTGGPGGQACASCHGADLRGGDTAPPLAGRSAAYLARMLWDFKTGARTGPAAAPMATPAGKLNEAQITDIVAYLAARAP